VLTNLEIEIKLEVKVGTKRTFSMIKSFEKYIGPE